MKKYSLLILSLLFAVSNSFAQDKDKNLSDEQINVVKPYEPTLSEAIKISTAPQKDTSKAVISKMNYSVSAKKLDTKIEVTPIKPAKIKDETILKLYNNYLKLGFGNYTTPYAELFINSMRSKTFSAGARLKHLSSTGQLTNTGFSGYSENELEAFGKRIFEKEVVSGSLGFSRDVVHYYGYKASDTTLSKSAIKQRFNCFSADVNVTDNFDPKNSLNHDVRLRYHLLSDLFNATENNVDLSFALGKKFSFGDIRLNGGVGYTGNKTDSAHSDRTTLAIEPYYTKTSPDWSFIGGFNMAIETNASKGFHMYSHLEGTYKMMENFVVAFGGISGGVERVTYKGVTNENPFVNSNVILNTINNKIVAWGGIKGQLSARNPYNLSLTYKETDNMPFFVNDSASILHNKFNIVYDNVSYINFHGELGHYLFEKLRIVGRADFYRYNMTHELKAWYKPAFIGTISTYYNIQQKIITRFDVYTISNQYAKIYQPTIASKSLNGLVDVNLGLEYRYSKIFSLFLNFNNIGAVRYYRWDNYPTQRFNVLGGLSYSF